MVILQDALGRTQGFVASGGIVGSEKPHSGHSLCCSLCTARGSHVGQSGSGCDSDRTVSSSPDRTVFEACLVAEAAAC